MKNILKKFESQGVDFFVAKSYLYATFEVDRRKDVYHIYFIKKNSNPDAYFEGYKDLKDRKMNRKVIDYFKKSIDNYELVLNNEHGKVFNLKSRPFDKTKCPKYKQYILSL